MEREHYRIILGGINTLSLNLLYFRKRDLINYVKCVFRRPILEFVEEALEHLSKCHLINYDGQSGYLVSRPLNVELDLPEYLRSGKGGKKPPSKAVTDVAKKKRGKSQKVKLIKLSPDGKEVESVTEMEVDEKMAADANDATDANDASDANEKPDSIEKHPVAAPANMSEEDLPKRLEVVPSTHDGCDPKTGHKSRSTIALPKKTIRNKEVKQKDVENSDEVEVTEDKKVPPKQDEVEPRKVEKPAATRQKRQQKKQSLPKPAEAKRKSPASKAASRNPRHKVVKLPKQRKPRANRQKKPLPAPTPEPSQCRTHHRRNNPKKRPTPKFKTNNKFRQAFGYKYKPSNKKLKKLRMRSSLEIESSFELSLHSSDDWTDWF